MLEPWVICEELLLVDCHTLHRILRRIIILIAGLLYVPSKYHSVQWQWSKNSCSALPVHTYVMPRIAAAGAKKNTMADQSTNTDN